MSPAKLRIYKSQLAIEQKKYEAAIRKNEAKFLENVKTSQLKLLEAIEERIHKANKSTKYFVEPTIADESRPGSIGYFGQHYGYVKYANPDDAAHVRVANEINRRSATKIVDYPTAWKIEPLYEFEFRYDPFRFKFINMQADVSMVQLGDDHVAVSGLDTRELISGREYGITTTAIVETPIGNTKRYFHIRVLNADERKKLEEYVLQKSAP